MPKTFPVDTSDSATINPSQSLDKLGIVSSKVERQIDELQKLKGQLEKTFLPPELKLKAERMLESLGRMQGSVGYNAEYNSVERYLDWICNLPWDKRSEDQLDLDKARDILDSTHYGLEDIKERILEHLAILKLQKEAAKNQETMDLGKEIEKQGQMRAATLFFVGLPGIGKTSIAYTIAKSLNRQFVRIAMGGMGDALQLRGQSQMHLDAEPGLIIKGLRRAGTKNPVILLDEIDRTAESARAQIMGVLLELLDPEQNFAFTDNFVDYPFNLSKALFIATANNTGNIATAVMDRLEIIEMPGYSDEEKAIIGKRYILPKALQGAGLSPQVLMIDETLWPQIVRPLGYDAGIRSLQRNIEGLVRKVAREVVEGNPGPYKITGENIGQYLS